VPTIGNAHNYTGVDNWYNATKIIECHTGYNLAGNETLVTTSCTEFGNWTEVPSQCQGMPFSHAMCALLETKELFNTAPLRPHHCHRFHHQPFTFHGWT